MLEHLWRKLATWPPGAGLARRREGGVHWRRSPGAAEFLAGAALDPGAWAAAGLAVAVKGNIHRAILRVDLPGGAVYLKRSGAATPRAWLRELVRPAKSRLEWENLHALAALGVAAVRPLAWGAPSRWWPGESLLVTRAEPGAVPLGDWLEAGLTPSRRREAARAFGGYLAQLHVAGVLHPDPHPGNVLVAAAGGGLAFFLMDLHAVKLLGRPLTWAESAANLVLWNRWFQVRAACTDRRRFWRSYAAARPGSLPLGVGGGGGLPPPTPPEREAARQVEAATAASNLRFWAARVKRYTARNRDTAPVRRGAVAGYADRRWPAEPLAAVLADPDALFAGPRLKDSRTSTVAPGTAPLATGAVPTVAKRFRLKSWKLALKNAVRPSPARRSWVNGLNLLDRGLPTARPLLVLERKRLGVGRTGYLVCERVPDALELPAALASIAWRPAVVRAWARRLGELVRRMHDREVSHRDLKAANVLMSGLADPPAARPVLIDLVGVEVGRAVPAATRARDLARLNASFLPPTPATRGDRLRLLKAYVGPGGEWKPLWRRVAAATAAKVERNRRTGRPLA